MKRIVHISDVHFGREIPAVVAGLIRDVRAANPDLVILSGDFTQRAHELQYEQACEMLERLPKPQLLIPGNHDIPLYNLVQRFSAPKHKYRRHLSSKTQMYFESDEVCVIGLDSARAFTVANGRLSNKQIAEAAKLLEKWGDRMKIVVTHHPYSAPKKFLKSKLIKNAKEALKAFSAAGADIFLAGHLHISYTGLTKERYPDVERNMLVISCGTSTSNRGRGEPNNFNILECEKDQVRIIRKWWENQEHKFITVAEQVFVKQEENWVELKHEPETLVQPTKTEEKPPNADNIMKTSDRWA